MGGTGYGCFGLGGFFLGLCLNQLILPPFYPKLTKSYRQSIDMMLLYAMRLSDKSISSSTF